MCPGFLQPQAPLVQHHSACHGTRFTVSYAIGGGVELSNAQLEELVPEENDLVLQVRRSVVDEFVPEEKELFSKTPSSHL